MCLLCVLHYFPLRACLILEFGTFKTVLFVSEILVTSQATGMYDVHIFYSYLLARIPYSYGSWVFIFCQLTSLRHDHDWGGKLTYLKTDI
ncbi:hypothetical protein BDR04DRAFT_346215 [Suillus decipiens]|nr:hypothetical protein BDR04DRAFT_346215 [Suillus decipiens]